MKKRSLVLVAALMVLGVQARCQGAAPIKLIQTLELPAEVKGNFDHFGIDMKGGRLFATPEGYHAVVVFDLKTGKLVHKIDGIGKPHVVLYREDLNRIYVTDGDAGDLKIFDGTTYGLVSSVKLLEDADSIGYDPVTKYLYIDNGGGDVHQTYSMLSVIDTPAGEKLADLMIEGETVEAMALDEANQRLFVACRSGVISVLDTQTGKEVTSFPITKGVDDITYDPASKRVYAACDGAIDIYEQSGHDSYRLLGNVSTGPMGRTARLVPELKRYFVAVPQYGTTSARVLVFDVL